MADTTASPPPAEPGPESQPTGQTDAPPEASPRPAAAPASTAGRRLIAASTVLAWLAVALFVAALAFLVIPVSNPGVQHCGTPGLFLLHGTQDAALTDPQGNPIHGLSQQQLQHAYDHRCSVRVAARGAWAAGLGAAFVVVGVVALAFALAGHRSARRGDLRAWSDAHQLT
jgi:hypothetical protein